MSRIIYKLLTSPMAVLVRENRGIDIDFLLQPTSYLHTAVVSPIGGGKCCQ